MSSEHQSSDGMQVELRRYPNRRYYDCTRSQHLTLDDIYRLVCDGYSVTVSDSKTGDDITGRILTQLILDHDPLKLAAFPTELLHQIIRSNESLLKDFVEKYFNGALTAFLKSQREFDRYLGQTLGIYGMPMMGCGWAEAMMGPFMRAFMSPNHQTPSAEQLAAESQGVAETDLRKAIAELQEEVATLRKALEQR